MPTVLSAADSHDNIQRECASEEVNKCFAINAGSLYLREAGSAIAAAQPSRKLNETSKHLL